MNETLVKSPEILPVGPIHVPAEPDPYQRAPTLMAGENPGSQGTVRVWYPDRRGLKIATVGFGLGSIALLVLIILSKNGGSFAYLMTCMFTSFFFSVSALRRPAYITTDDGGIGLTTGKGTRALRWDEIESIHQQIVPNNLAGSRSILVLKAPDEIRVNLTGYPNQLRGELVYTITSRAGLQRQPGRREIYSRNTPPLPTPSSPQLSNPQQNLEGQR